MKEQTYPLALVDEILKRLNTLREQLGGRPEPEADSQENAIRNSILQLMDVDAPDHRGRMRKLFHQASHWQAVYRILVDCRLGASDGDYIGFSTWMQRIMPDDCRVPFSYEAFRSISRTPFVRPFARWHYDSAYFQTRLPYENMVRLAETFLQILKENGVVKH